MNDRLEKKIVIEKRLLKQLLKIKSENIELYAKIMAAIQSLSRFRIEDNFLVTKLLEKNLFELKVNSNNKYIRIFYSESSTKIICWELLEKKTNQLPTVLMSNLRKKVRNWTK